MLFIRDFGGDSDPYTPTTAYMDPVGHTCRACPTILIVPRPTHFTHTHFERFERLEENWNDGGQSGGELVGTSR